MKKLFAVVLMAVAFAMPSKAQFSWGIQAGLNMSNVSVKEAAENAGEAVKSRTGFFVGPTVKFTLPIVGLGIDASALYDQREGKAGDEVIKSSSIQIPINVRYGFGLGSVAEVFAFAGPQFGFKLSGDNIALGKTGEMKGKDAAGVMQEIGSAKFNAWQVSLAYFF